jgi:predicted transcriptional regulator
MTQDHDDKRIPENLLLKMTTDVVAAYLSNNVVSAEQIPNVIDTVLNSLRETRGETVEVKAEPLKPAVTVRKSVTPDYIVCLEDGKKLKMLKRHLRTMYNLSPDDYRAKWNLPSDYPMVAPNYAKQRSDFAKQIGLGRSSAKPVRRKRAVG